MLDGARRLISRVVPLDAVVGERSVPEPAPEQLALGGCVLQLQGGGLEAGVRLRAGGVDKW